MTLISDLFHVPFPFAVSYCTIDSLSKEHELTSQERAIFHSKHSHEARLSFLSGRIAAHEALDYFNATQEVLAIESQGQRSAPRWPSGFYGSIAHTSSTKNSSTAVSVTSPHQRYVGIDIEESSRAISSSLEERIASPKELSTSSQQLTTSLLSIFCIKEALYKSLWPILMTPLSFSDAEIDLKNRSIVLSEHLLSHQTLKQMTFHYLQQSHDGFIITVTFASPL